MTEALLESTPGDLKVALDAGAAIAGATSIHRTAVAHVVPDGYKIETQDLDCYFDHPSRKRGTVHPATVDALSAYVARHENATVIEGKEAQAPGHGDHRAHLKLDHTPEWEFWFNRDGRKFTQAEFAEHIEDGAREIVEPTSAELLEIASTFHAKTDVTFRQATRLQDGTASLVFDEITSAGAGAAGDIKIPQTIGLAISPFVGEAKFAVNARLRYRVSGGKLELGYHLDRPHDVIRTALDLVRERLAREFPGAVFVGTPR